MQSTLLQRAMALLKITVRLTQACIPRTSILGIMATPTFSAPLNADQEHRLDLMRAISAYDPVEGGTPLGDGGANFGLGMQMFEGTPVDGLFGGSKPETALLERQHLPKLTVLRGLTYPIDIGMQYGVFNATGVGMVGGHLQYTWFDRFRWPNLATRISYSTLTGAPAQGLSSLGMGIFASYGIFSWFQGYFGAGVQRESFHLTLDDTAVSEATIASPAHGTTARDDQDRSGQRIAGRATSRQIFYGIKTKFGVSAIGLNCGYNTSDIRNSGSYNVKLTYGF